MENNKPIVIVGLGDGGSIEETFHAIEIAKHFDVPPVFHHAPKNSTAEELELIYERYKESGKEVVILVDDKSEDYVTGSLPELAVSLLETTKDRLDSYKAELYIKEDNKPKQYPKRNWKNKLKKNRKRKK